MICRACQVAKHTDCSDLQKPDRLYSSCYCGHQRRTEPEGDAA